MNYKYKTTKEEAITQINNLQNVLWRYQDSGVDFDDIPEVLDDAITLTKVLFFEYVNEENDE